MDGGLGRQMKGGTKEFNWSNVRQASYKDRECYLGYSTKVGYLDKGGKWKKRDWWTKLEKTEDSNVDEVAAEKLRDEKRMRIAL